MDRQLLAGLAIAMALLVGCSKSKSPPPTAAAAPRHEYQTDNATATPTASDGAAYSGSGSASGGSGLGSIGGGGGGATAMPPPTPNAQSWQPNFIPPAEQARAEQAFAEQQAREAALHRQAELQLEAARAAMAVPPAPFPQQPSSSPAPPRLAPAAPQQAGNPLRREAMPPVPPAMPNPLRIGRDDSPAGGAAPPAFPVELPSIGDSPLAGGAPPPPSPLPAAAAPAPGAESIGGNLPIRASGADSSTAGPASPGLAVMEPAAASAEPDSLPDGYDNIEVFYGTDRRSATPGAVTAAGLLLHFLPTGCCALVVVGLAMAAMSRKSLMLWLATGGGLTVAIGLGYLGAVDTLNSLRNDGKEGPRYTTERSAGGHVDLGICHITIPHEHAPGELEAPSVTRLEVREDASRHVILQRTELLGDPRFYELLRQRVSLSSRRELFVFIHGFNVSFEDAARRTAQIHHDLKFDGAPIFYSWPAHDKFIFTYPADENNATWSVPHLKQFLLSIVKHSQASSINLIAHSMGNRALTAALREIELEMHDESRLFNQVILAAPDIDADDFRNNIAPAMQRTAQRMTLYVSGRDDALLASQFIHRQPRAGDAGDSLVVVPGIDTIDVTPIDSSPWGHSYYGSSDPVLRDLRELFSRAIPPRDRTWLSPAERNGQTYWIFQPTRTAGLDAGTPR